MKQLPQVSPEVVALCEQWYLQFMLKGMGAGGSPAQVWANDPDNPSAAFIWDTTHSLYLVGDATDAAFNQALREFITDTLLPEAHQRDLGIFKVQTASDAWSAQVEALFAPLQVEVRPRVLYSIDPGSVPQPLDDVPADLHLSEIDAALLSGDARLKVAPIVEEINACWVSEARFLADGFGVCLLDERNEAVGWCTAEYVSAGVCGVGIEVREIYQERGLATLLARAFSRHAAQKGITLYWDAWQTNTPSVRVAEKAGFQKVTDYVIHLVRLNP
jgi:GNAT superfamily N-acetyltransferase